MLTGAMISWAFKHQPVTAISSTESEFYSVSLCGLDCVYLRRMIMDIIGYKRNRATPIAQDNNACIYLVKGSGMYNQARHIDTCVYRIRELATGATPGVHLYTITGEDLTRVCIAFASSLQEPHPESIYTRLQGKTNRQTS